jgi:hypothetical protein
MISTISLYEVLAEEPIPQAVLRIPFIRFSDQFFEHVVRDNDGLDQFEGLGFSLDNDLHFALMHHRVDDENETTLYLPMAIRDVEDITKLVLRIVSELDLSPHAVAWQRAGGLPA